nr:MAG TPA: hypothetical protein [Caudoviricetes sp.]
MFYFTDKSREVLYNSRDFFIFHLLYCSICRI